MSVVLVVDDEPHLVRTLAINLRARDYEVETAQDGRSALQAFHEREPDLIVLDLGLPDLDGVEVLRRVRGVRGAGDRAFGAQRVGRQGRGARRGRGRLRHEALRHGGAPGPGAGCPAPEPGVGQSLAAAVRDRPLPARLRRAPRGHRRRRDAADADGVAAAVVLARRPGHLVSQRDLLREVWGPGYGRESNYLRVYANQLRRKLEPDPTRPRYLLTEPGQGYRLVRSD